MDNDVVDYEIAFDDHAGAFETKTRERRFVTRSLLHSKGADRLFWTPWANGED